MSRFGEIGISIFLFTLLEGVAVLADPLTPFHITDVGVDVATTTTCAVCLDLTADPSYSFSQTGSDFSVSMSGLAESSYGVLRSSLVSSFSSTSNAYHTDLNATAEFQDILTISFAPFNGKQGLLALNFNLDGTLSGSAPGTLPVQSAEPALTDVESCVGALTEGTPECQSDVFTPSTPTVSGTFGYPHFFTFTYGQPFPLLFNLNVSGLYGICQVLCTFTGTGSTNEDFSDTLVLSGLQVFDQSGNPVTGATFTSESGTQYGPTGVIPEPSFFKLIFIGLVALVFASRSNTFRTPKYLD